VQPWDAAEWGRMPPGWPCVCLRNLELARGATFGDGDCSNRLDTEDAGDAVSEVDNISECEDWSVELGAAAAGQAKIPSQLISSEPNDVQKSSKSRPNAFVFVLVGGQRTGYLEVSFEGTEEGGRVVQMDRTMVLQSPS